MHVGVCLCGRVYVNTSIFTYLFLSFFSCEEFKIRMLFESESEEHDNMKRYEVTCCLHVAGARVSSVG